MPTLSYKGEIIAGNLARGQRLSVTTGEVLVELIRDGAAVTTDLADRATTYGPYEVEYFYRLTVVLAPVTYTVGVFSAAEASLDVQASVDYSETGHSYQVVAADLTLSADAGSDDGTDPKFLAAVMGNVMGDAVAGEGNYIAGVIGAYSPTGATDSDYPKAGVVGVVMDGGVGADACVLAVIDGSDPSAVTRATAAFGVAVNNNDAGSGVDWGLDLHATPNTHYTGTGEGLNVAKAEVRLSNEVCIITGDAAPVDYTDGSPPATGETYAEKGSIYIRTNTGKLYVNGGTKAQPIWKLVTSA